MHTCLALRLINSFPHSLSIPMTSFRQTGTCVGWVLPYFLSPLLNIDEKVICGHVFQALKETQKNLSLDQKDGNGERPSSQSSFESRLLQEHLEPPIDPKCRNKSPPTIIVHSPLDNEWEKQRDGEISACQSPFETHSGLCRRMGSLSLE